MAITRITQKDIGNYESKLLGPLTTRQTIIMAVGVVPTMFIDYAIYNMGVDMYTLFGITMVLMIIPTFIAFGKSLTYGMNPEDFLKEYYQYHILPPKVRLYKTETLDDVLEKKAKKEAQKSEEVNGSNKKKKDKTNKKTTKKSRDPLATKYKDKKFVTYAHVENKAYKSFS